MLLVTITVLNIAVLLISDSKRREVRWFRPPGDVLLDQESWLRSLNIAESLCAESSDFHYVLNHYAEYSRFVDQ